MKELLSPVGNKEAFYAAIANGCDAVYLGLDKFNARAYAPNFNLDNLKEYVDYAHLRNVRVFVTLNTIIYDNELEDIYKIIDELANMNVDAIIVQDLAVLNYALNNYKSLEVHASTQMGIDDFYGASLLKELGAKRVVLARETPIETIKEIKNKTNIEVETFIHGALCVSYSGNCFMSAALGERSGNRGRCAGCCRKLYTLIDLDNKESVQTGYLLSMKDLNLSSYIKEMNLIDSFKIEGRMKEPTYVASVTNTYRRIIDNEKIDNKILNKVFNRTYTKGFINHEDNKDITNINRPNNYGFLIGKVIKVYDNKIWIKLYEELNQGDHIRIENPYSFDDVNLPISKIFNSNFETITSSKNTVVIYIDKKVKINSLVYKTKDIKFNKTINLGDTYIKEYKKLPLRFDISVKLDQSILLKATYKNHTVYSKSEYIVTSAIKNPTTKENIYNHLSKLNDTPYSIDELNINLDENVFVPVKTINDLRRDIIEKLNKSRLNLKVIKNKNPLIIKPKSHVRTKPQLTFEVSTEEQYKYLKELGYKDIYYKNIIRRNNVTYLDNIDTLLIGGLSSINYYKNKDVNLISDYSLNVNNHISVALLSSLGVDRITLSYEINEEQIKNLINKYKEEYNTDPNLEFIVYGRASLMHTKYCPLRRLGMCGKCKENKYALKDAYESFPLRFNDDCTVNVLNSKILNLLDEIPYIDGINYFRLVFTTETVEEMKQIIELAKLKLEGDTLTKTFKGESHTRGNFKKQLL